MFSGASDDMKPIVGGFYVHALSNRKTERKIMKTTEKESRLYTVGKEEPTAIQRKYMLIHILCADFIFRQ